MEIAQSLYIFSKTILLIIFGVFCVLIVIKIYSILKKIEEYIKEKVKFSTAILKLDSREKLQKLIDKEKSEKSGQLMTFDEIENYIDNIE